MHPAIRVCHFVSSTSLLESCVYVLPARGRTVGGACPPSPLSAYPDPLRHARRPGKSGSGVRRPPGARVDRARYVLKLRFCDYAIARKRVDRGSGGRVVTSFTRVTFSFSRALGPRSGRQEPVAFYLLKHVRILRLSVSVSVRSRRRRVVARCRAVTFCDR
jgi:hypothetical protein